MVHFLLRFTFSCCASHSSSLHCPGGLRFLITTELKLTFSPNRLFFTVVQQDKQSSQALWCSQPQGLFCFSPLPDSEGVAQWKKGILGFGPGSHQILLHPLSVKLLGKKICFFFPSPTLFLSLIISNYGLPNLLAIDLWIGLMLSGGKGRNIHKNFEHTQKF